MDPGRAQPVARARRPDGPAARIARPDRLPGLRADPDHAPADGRSPGMERHLHAHVHLPHLGRGRAAPDRAGGVVGPGSGADRPRSAGCAVVRAARRFGVGQCAEGRPCLGGALHPRTRRRGPAAGGGHRGHVRQPVEGHRSPEPAHRIAAGEPARLPGDAATLLGGHQRADRLRARCLAPAARLRARRPLVPGGGGPSRGPAVAAHGAPGEARPAGAREATVSVSRAPSSRRCSRRRPTRSA